jgi:hypothetical protein
VGGFGLSDSALKSYYALFCQVCKKKGLGPVLLPTSFSQNLVSIVRRQFSRCPRMSATSCLVGLSSPRLQRVRPRRGRRGAAYDHCAASKKVPPPSLRATSPAYSGRGQGPRRLCCARSRYSKVFCLGRVLVKALPYTQNAERLSFAS